MLLAQFKAIIERYFYVKLIACDFTVILSLILLYKCKKKSTLIYCLYIVIRLLLLLSVAVKHLLMTGKSWLIIISVPIEIYINIHYTGLLKFLAVISCN